MKRAANTDWTRFAGAAWRARQTLRAIISKTVADQDHELTLREIRDLAADGAAAVQMALKKPG